MVNVDDIGKVKEAEEGKDRLVVIFERQQELIDKYHGIEEASGLRLSNDLPVDLHDPRGQSTLKDYAWRITEELGEALEAYNLHKGMTHCHEELIDALHFLVEFTIYAGMSPQQLIPDAVGTYRDILHHVFTAARMGVEEKYSIIPLGKITQYPTLLIWSGLTVEALAKTCNTLKNKPWKQSHMLTDIPKFQELLKDTWIKFLGLCIVSGMDEDFLLKVYLDKNAVNQFRQRSQY